MAEITQPTRNLSLNRSILMVATVLVGLSAGFFFAYEASVTVGLAQVDDATYVETFQAINATIRNPAFGLVFFGSVPAIAAAAAANWSTAPTLARLLLAAALPLYLAGLVITVTGNVPLNNDLAEVLVTTPGAASAARSVFEADWNQLNLIRSIIVGASFASLAAASILLSAGVYGSRDVARQTG